MFYCGRREDNAMYTKLLTADQRPCRLESIGQKVRVVAPPGYMFSNGATEREFETGDQASEALASDVLSIIGDD